MFRYRKVVPTGFSVQVSQQDAVKTKKMIVRLLKIPVMPMFSLLTSYATLKQKFDRIEWGEKQL